MPIIVRRDNVGDLGTLAQQAGRAVGTQQRRERQQVIDAQFIQAALNRAGGSPGVYGSRPGDFGYTGGGPTQYEGTAPVATHVNLEAQEAASAREAATQTAAKRTAFKEAAAAGPDALAQFLAQDQLTTTGQVSPGLLEILAGGGKGKAPAAAGDKRQGVSQFQRDVETQLGTGNVSGVDYLSQRKPGEYDPSAPPGTMPTARPTQEAIQAGNALSQVTAGMDAAALRALRAQLLSGPISPQAKAQALQIVDQQLAMKQAQRDVEIAQVYDEAIRRATEKIITRGTTGATTSRSDQRRAVGKEAVKIAGEYGIAPNELADWLGRMNSQADQIQDSMNQSMQPAPRPAAAPSAPTPAPGGGQTFQ